MDFVSTGFQYGRNRWRQISFGISTWLGRFQARLVGAKLGRDVKFFGRPYLQKARDATLEIGDHCSFRSAPTSNLIGINRPCILSANDNGRLTIGEHCGFSGTVIGCFREITIEPHVRCGANTLITDGDWHSNDPRSGPEKPIRIKKNVWLGVNAVVLKGVTIGENTVIGAGSVVTRDIPDNVIAAGNPCRVIRRLDARIFPEA